MIRFTCPKCKKDTYTAKTDTFTPCPYCGCIFSGKFGIEKREERRVKQKIDFFLQHGGRELKASTVDISDSGLGIEIYGEGPFLKDEILELTIGELKLKAMIIWVERLHDKSIAGLKRLN